MFTTLSQDGSFDRMAKFCLFKHNAPIVHEAITRFDAPPPSYPPHRVNSEK